MDRLADLRPKRPAVAFSLDLAAAVVLAAIGVNELRSVGDDIFYRSADLLGVVLILAQTLPLIARRVAPVVVTAIICAASAAGLWAGYPGTNALLAVPLALYSVGATRSRRDSALMTIAAVAVVVPPLVASESGDLSSVVVAIATFAVGTFAGGGVRARRLYAEALEVQAQQAEQQRALEAREAVVHERTRIARELHDAVGHTVNVMVMQAGAGRMAAEVDVSRSVQALASIEEIGRATLGDIDRLLGLLGDDDNDATRAPTPGIRELPALVERLAAAGLNVQLHIGGETATIPAPVDAATYRIVQEALTNAMKYAGPAQVRADVTVSTTELTIDVVDDGAGPRDQRNGGRAHGGRGLIGMAERTKALHGELRYGQRSEGGFEVRARLPINGPSVPTPSPPTHSPPNPPERP